MDIAQINLDKGFMLESVMGTALGALLYALCADLEEALTTPHVREQHYWLREVTDDWVRFAFVANNLFVHDDKKNLITWAFKKGMAINDGSQPPQIQASGILTKAWWAITNGLFSDFLGSFPIPEVSLQFGDKKSDMLNAFLAMTGPAGAA